MCEKCQKQQAKVHLTEIVNAEKREAHLCEECAKSAGVGVNFNFSIPDLLGNFMEEKNIKVGKKMLNTACPDCGITFADFKAKARVGCAKDYQVFRSGLSTLLEKIHGATQHVGKVPQTADVQIRKENELIRLKRELDAVVKAEDFERAAGLRDRIRNLEVELGNSIS